MTENYKLTKADKAAIFERREAGEFLDDIGATYGVSRERVRQVVNEVRRERERANAPDPCRIEDTPGLTVRARNGLLNLGYTDLRALEGINLRAWEGHNPNLGARSLRNIANVCAGLGLNVTYGPLKPNRKASDTNLTETATTLRATIQDLRERLKAMGASLRDEKKARKNLETEVTRLETALRVERDNHKATYDRATRLKTDNAALERQTREAHAKRVEAERKLAERTHADA